MALDDIGAKITAAMDARSKKHEKQRRAEAERRRKAAEKVDPHEDMTAPNLAAATKHYETTEADPTSKEGDAS